MEEERLVIIEKSRKDARSPQEKRTADLIQVDGTINAAEKNRKLNRRTRLGGDRKYQKENTKTGPSKKVLRTGRGGPQERREKAATNVKRHGGGGGVGGGMAHTTKGGKGKVRRKERTTKGEQQEKTNIKQGKGLEDTLTSRRECSKHKNRQGLPLVGVR